MKRLGDYIRQVDVRNRKPKVTKLLGLTIEKAFIPSVANVTSTDLSNYKVIRREQFACSLMQISRDGKMPVAMFKEEEAIMSPAYPMFEVINKKNKSGGTPNRNHTEYWNKKDYPWLKTGEVQNNVIVKAEEYISTDGMKHNDNYPLCNALRYNCREYSFMPT